MLFKNRGSLHLYSKWTFVILVLLAAILSISGRLILSNANYFKTQIEEELAEYGITGVSLDSVKGGWQGFHPLLKIKGASLSIPGRSQALSINELELSVNFFVSVFTANLNLLSFNASIEKLILVRDENDQWWLNDILISGEQGTAQSSPNFYQLFHQLPDSVQVSLGLIQLRDLLHDREYLIQQSSLRSSRIDDHVSLELLADLPLSLGGKFKFNLIGDKQKQNLYVDAENVNFVEWMQLFGIQQKSLSVTRASVQSWGEFEKFKPRQIKNRVKVTELRLKNKDTESQRAQFTFRQHITHQGESWRINTIANPWRWGDSRINGFKSQVYLESAQKSPLLWVDRINLQKLQPVLMDVIQDESVRKQIRGINALVQVKNLVAEVDVENIKASKLWLDFFNLNTTAYKAIPGVEGVNGEVVYADGKSHIDVNSRAMKVKFTELFRDPMIFTDFSAAMDIDLNDDQLLSEITQLNLKNQDIEFQGRAWLEKKSGEKPFMSLRANYAKGVVASTSKYLPVSIMPAGTVKWLDRAIKGGEITEGDLLFHGRLNKLSELQNNSSGKFHALFKLKDPQVKFLKDWPVAERGQGLASFHNLSMNLDFTDVSFSAAQAKQAKISIANLKKSELNIEVSTKSSAKNLVTALSDLPILPMFDDIKNKHKALTGSVSGDVSIRIPLSSKVKTKQSIKVKAELKDVAMSIPEWMVDFKKLNGKLEIKDDQVFADKLTALYYDDAATLMVKPDVSKKRTVINLDANLSSRKLLSLVPEYLQKPVSGKSPWNLQVSLSHNPESSTPKVKIKASSTLSGTRIDAPQPFRLDKKETIPVVFKAHLSRFNELSYQAVLKGRMTAAGKVNTEQSSSQNKARFSLNFGQSTSARVINGISLSGQLEELDVNQWTDYVGSQTEGEGLDTSEILQQLEHTDIKINKLLWGNQNATNVHIVSSNDGQYLQADVDSSHVKGKVTLPYKITKQSPLKADLEYLRLYKTGLKEKFEPEIEQMPNLDIRSKIASYDEMEFSNLVLRTETTPGDFYIKHLDFSRDSVQLKSSGHWQKSEKNNENFSVFNIDIQGKDFGKAVNALGLGETIQKGKVKFNGQIGWAGSLHEMNWPTLIGEVQLSLKDGFLKNVDPGAGRFVGLLSFNALPKRLFLDFGDVLKEGMQFNEIKGDFSIKGEIMSTNNASMKSPSARVKVRGITDLRNKTYDQSMSIIPHVGDTLPVIGTLAAGSTVGWGLLLIQRIFKKPIDKSVEIKYDVTGPWDDPKIELVSKPVIKPQSEDLFLNENE